VNQKERRGQIITFYSYKGGTGRTMALANCACLLARGFERVTGEEFAPKKVLVIDWDLEAPGLHRYFQSLIASETPDEVFRAQPGLIDLLLKVDEATADWSSKDRESRRAGALQLFESLGFSDFRLETKIPGLFLMTAGRQDDDYSARVNRFRWEALYKRSAAVFPAMADFLGTQFDYTLIDSRSGITDISGICTTLLPEKLVVVFTPNRQSLTGIVRLVRDATHYRRQSDDWRSLSVFPLPSRVEPAKPELLKYWRFGGQSEDSADTTWIGYQKQFEALFTEMFALPECDLTDYFDEVQIQHIPDYAYGEPVAVELERGERLSLRRSYENFTVRLISLSGPWEDLQAAADQKEVDRLQARAADRFKAGELAAAEKDLMRALDLHESSPRVQSPQLAMALEELAARQMEEGRFQEALGALNGALEIAKRAFGRDHPQIAHYLQQLAVLLGQLGRFEQAMSLIDQALVIQVKAFGEDHLSVADTYDAKAQLLCSMGQISESEDFLQRSLEIRKRELGPKDPMVAETLNRLGGVADSLGQKEKARTLFEQALDILESLESVQTQKADTLRNIGRLHLDLGELDEAKTFLQGALELRESVLGSDHPRVADSLDDLADVAMLHRDFEQAEKLYEQAQTIREEMLGVAHPDTIKSQTNMAQLAQIKGQLDRAESLYKRALSQAERTLGLQHPFIADILNGLTSLYRGQYEYDKGFTYYSHSSAQLKQEIEHHEQVLATSRETGDRHGEGEALANLGTAYTALEQMERAIEYYEYALGISRELGNRRDEEYNLINLGHNYYSLGQMKQTIEYYRAALAVHREIGDQRSTAKHVYISYSRKEQSYARSLAEVLRGRGFNVWIDDSINLGDRWWQMITQAIRDCAAFIVIMTPDSMESEWVEREVLMAQRESKPIFPLLLRGQGFPLLITMQYVDVTGGHMPPQSFFDRLSRSMSS
jgi:tetratricopeptide (TPR) repeat protein/cellulose biosynthesis protein BcsQ